jgi:glycosidase
VPINLNYLSTGTGTGQINLVFDFSKSGVTPSAATLKLVDPTGAVSTPSLGSTSGSYTYSNSSAPVGSYQIFFTASTATQTAYKVEALEVFQGVTTAATLSLASGDFSASYIPVTSLSLNKTTASVPLGQTDLLTPTFNPGASNTLLTWTSSTPSVATVGSNGVVQTLSSGTTTITATSVDNPKVSASCVYTVTTPVITIHYKSSWSAAAPTIWVWELNGGTSISQAEGYTWPGPAMAKDSATDWWTWTIPAKYYPLSTGLGFKFAGGSEVDLTGAVTASEWYNGSAWSLSNPDGPTATANPGTSSFSTSTLSVTLSASNPATGNYTIDGGASQSFTSGQLITLGGSLAVGQSTTLVVTNGTASNTYTYTKAATPSGLRIYYKSTTAPTIWVWELNGGPAISTLSGGTWPGPGMTSDPSNPGWFYYDIPSAYLPVANTLAFKFAAGAEVDLPGPYASTEWYNGSAWSTSNPDPATAPVISMTPNGGWFGSSSSASAVITVATSSKAPLSNATYTIGSGSPVNFTSSSQSITVPLSTVPVVVSVSATNSVGTTSWASQTFQQGIEPIPTFSWNNATVYFILTDRFKASDPTKANAYGRPKVDASGSNIATFHGGDLKGITSEINANYFTNLGVNVLWISAPYEQIHGFVGGGSAGDFAHYGYHGYYALDYTNLDANFGTPADLQALITAAHTKGIRVVMDIVMNHPGYNTMQDMLEENFGAWTGTPLSLSAAEAWKPASGGTWFDYNNLIDYNSSAATAPWSNWWGTNWIRAGISGYATDSSSDYTLNVGGLPDFKTENTTPVPLPVFLQNKATFGQGYLTPYTVTAGETKRVRDWITEWLVKYVHDYGLDGFRCDTAKNVEPDSWGYMKTQAISALQQWRVNNPGAPGANWTDNFWTVGEYWGHGLGYDPNMNGTGKFDALINFTYFGSLPTVTASASALSGLESTYSSYATQINGQTAPQANAYPWNVLTFGDDHDEGALFFNGDLERQKRMGTALLMTPGDVQIFYGDEYGRAEGPTGSDPSQGSRSDFNWTSEASESGVANSCLSHWQILGEFRNKHIAIGAGTHQQITDVTNGYAFTRVWNSDKVAVVMGASGSVAVNVSTIFPDGTLVRNFYDGTTATVSGGHVTFNAGVNGVILIENASS